MKDKDKKIVKDSALVLADAVAAVIGPSVTVAWALSKALFGAGMKLREDRALEFIEFIRINPNIFINEILATTEFQDGFVFTFERFLRERSEKKRFFMKNVFLGFTKSPYKSSFTLEKYLNILEQLYADDIEVLKIFTDDSIVKWHSEYYPNNPKVLTAQFILYPKINQKQASLVLSKIRNDSKFDYVRYVFEILVRLSNLGLIHGQININGRTPNGLFAVADFGKEFIKFVSDQDTL